MHIKIPRSYVEPGENCESDVIEALNECRMHLLSICRRIECILYTLHNLYIYDTHRIKSQHLSKLNGAHRTCEYIEEPSVASVLMQTLMHAQLHNRICDDSLDTQIQNEM